MTATRTANSVNPVDILTGTDDKGQVRYNSTNATQVNLNAGAPSMGLDIVNKGTGTVTFQALNNATLNGTINGSFSPTINTPYRLFTPGTDGKNPADWYIK